MRTGFVGDSLRGNERDSPLVAVQDAPRGLLTARFFWKRTLCVRVWEVLWVLISGLNYLHNFVFK